MLEEAIRIAREGKNVCVLSGNLLAVTGLEERAVAIIREKIGLDFIARPRVARKIQFKGAGTIHFESLQRPNFESVFDHHTMQFQERGKEEMPALIDHFGIETYYAKVLEMLHRFD